MEINSAVFYIEKIKKLQNISSDYGVAKLLKVPPSRIAMYRNGKVSLDNAVALDVAKYAEVDARQIIFHAKAFKATNLGDDIAAVRWLVLARKQ